jgi:hypothetical protein
MLDRWHNSFCSTGQIDELAKQLSDMKEMPWQRPPAPRFSAAGTPCFDVEFVQQVKNTSSKWTLFLGKASKNERFMLAHKIAIDEVSAAIAEPPDVFVKFCDAHYKEQFCVLVSAHEKVFAANAARTGGPYRVL